MAFGRISLVEMRERLRVYAKNRRVQPLASTTPLRSRLGNTANVARGLGMAAEFRGGLRVGGPVKHYANLMIGGMLQGDRIELQPA